MIYINKILNYKHFCIKNYRNFSIHNTKCIIGKKFVSNIWPDWKHSETTFQAQKNHCNNRDFITGKKVYIIHRICLHRIIGNNRKQKLCHPKQTLFLFFICYLLYSK